MPILNKPSTSDQMTQQKTKSISFLESDYDLYDYLNTKQNFSFYARQVFRREMEYENTLKVYGCIEEGGFEDMNERLLDDAYSASLLISINKMDEALSELKIELIKNGRIKGVEGETENELRTLAYRAPIGGDHKPKRNWYLNREIERGMEIKTLWHKYTVITLFFSLCLLLNVVLSHHSPFWLAVWGYTRSIFEILAVSFALKGVLSIITKTAEIYTVLHDNKDVRPKRIREVISLIKNL